MICIFNKKTIIIVSLIINSILICLKKIDEIKEKEKKVRFTKSEYRNFIKLHLYIFKAEKPLLSKEIEYIGNAKIKCLKFVKMGAILLSNLNIQLFK